MANRTSSHYPDIGTLGEDLVAQWLQSTGWIVLHRRFSCRWGEIDIIAQFEDGKPDNLMLAFIEVKTRSSLNWDAGGRSAITRQKQAKLFSTAQMFLSEYPEKADYPCRFDVAIVQCQRISKKLRAVIASSEVLASSSDGVHYLTLQEYIPAAFDVNDVGYNS
ncbi:MAG: YraN family protein [Tolypothrix carrinoi HA7290-LM1]|jgi:putative endonuclease|nr:YraN family protein [Tolypothrix carrinoi HA7290-LM1]